MRVFDYTAFLAALVLYVPRLLLFWIYRALLFISKPGAGYLILGGLLALFYWQYDNIPQWPLAIWWAEVALQDMFFDQPYWFNLTALWAIVFFVLKILNSGETPILGTLMSAFPQMRRPFPPSLRLRLVEKKIRPARVTQAVPALKRRRRGKHAPDLSAGLTDQLKQLLETPKPSVVSPAPQHIPSQQEARARRKPPPPPVPPMPPAIGR